MLKSNFKKASIGAVFSMALLLGACSGEAADGPVTEDPVTEDQVTSSKALENVATEILAMPSFDDSDGLVLAGEKIADAALLEAARSEKLVWYTGSGTRSAELTAARFAAETGVEIEMTRLPSSKLGERVLSEAGAGQLSAGVVTVTDPNIAQNFADEGIVVPYETPLYAELSQMGPIVWDSGAYYTVYYSAYAFAYNNQLVDEANAPAKWADLIDPQWEGVFGMVNAGAGGTVQGLAYFQKNAFGEKYWEDLAALQPRIFDTTSPQIDALARGELTLGTIGFNSTYAAILDGAPIELVVPEDGISGTFNMQGLTTVGKDNPAAQLFMNWTMGKSGQQFAAAQGFVGVRTDIEQIATGPYQLPRADDSTFFLYTPEMAKEFGEDTVARWNTAFGYTG
jgi:iron(III) transport system substrate-binding protein